MKYALVILLSLLSFNSFADCIAKYRSAIGNANAHAYNKSENWMPLYIITPVGTTAQIATSSERDLKVKKYKKVLNLLRDAQAGNGIHLATVMTELESANIIMSMDELSQHIQEDNLDNVYCRGDMYSYNEIVDYLKKIY